MQGIKNIIFDLGGIFLDLNYQLTEQAFVQLGITNFNELFTQHHANPLFELLETGKITAEDFYTQFREQTKATHLTNEQIQDAWNALLLGFNPAKITWLQQIKNKYNIYLFSNTNQIHYDAFVEIFKKDVGNIDFDSLFVKAYYSQNMGLRKPYAESFLYILNEQQLNPAETLFIDDTLKNIEGAKAVGLQTLLLTQEENVTDIGL